MNKWISVKDRMPIDRDSVSTHEVIEVLIVSGGKTEFCEFEVGPKPTPWFKWGDFHPGYVTHWMHKPEPTIE